MKALLINPPYFRQIFADSIVKAMVSPGIMPLGLACVAGSLREESTPVEILDLNLFADPRRALKEKIGSFRPDIIGVTFTTPLFDMAIFLAGLIKKIDPKIVAVCGGPHVSILPEETLRKSAFDIAILGEGDRTFKRIVSGEPLKDVDGIAYKEGVHVVVQRSKGYIENLDDLPFAAVDLFDVSKYTYPKVTVKRNPVASLETSRGCFARCVYCNKSVFGYKFRTKTAVRIVDEMEFVLRTGYKEIHIVDDGFTTDMQRAFSICREIQKRGLQFPWYVRGGIRVDRVSKELLQEMKSAGCYRVPYGIESGDQDVLNSIKKGITLKQVKDAVKWAKETGMIVDGYFMLGLPNDTIETMERSIAFACALPIDYVKFAITIPLPGTELFSDLKRDGCLLSEDWMKYNFASSPREIYKHRNIGWDDLERYYKVAHKKFYMRPGYILDRIFAGMKRGELTAYIKAFFDFRRALSK